MHDCREIESRLVDLVFGELEADDRLRLIGETENCTRCSNARRNMTSTLVVFDRTAEAASPGENFWMGYEERLLEKLSALPQRAPEKPAPLWKRIFAVSLPVPVPVAAVIVIALLVSSVLALRHPSSEAATTTTQAASPMLPSSTPVRIVEVPVVSERVVTRVVYIEKQGREKSAARRAPALIAQSKPGAGGGAASAEEEQSGFITRANLDGFQPTSEVKIRMIRRSDEVEK